MGLGCREGELRTAQQSARGLRGPVCGCVAASGSSSHWTHGKRGSGGHGRLLVGVPVREPHRETALLLRQRPRPVSAIPFLPWEVTITEVPTQGLRHCAGLSLPLHLLLESVGPSVQV